MTDRIGEPYPSLRLRPTDNGYLRIKDPADRVQTCQSCGEDFDPAASRRSDAWRCACFPKEVA